MSFKFNPFTGNLDYYEANSGSSGISFADLASPPAGTALGSVALPFSTLFLVGTTFNGIGTDGPGTISLLNQTATFDGTAGNPEVFSQSITFAPIADNNYAYLSDSYINIPSSVNQAGLFVEGQYLEVVSNAAGSSGGFITVKGTEILAYSGSGAANYSYIQGGTQGVSHRGSGNTQNLWGNQISANVNGLGTVDSIIGNEIEVGAYAGHATTVWGVSVLPQTGGTIDTFVSHFNYDLAGVATNSYYGWDDARGVRRVKEDATFDGVGQAIEALYNPRFTKYTAGLANYERIVQQWETDVATIRTEAGGTGTLRSINLAGNTVQLNGKTITLSGNLTTTGAFNPTFAIPSSSTWTFPSGGGTLSTTTGTVTSIATTSPISGGTITGTGTISLLVNTDFAWTAGQTITAPAGSKALTLVGGTQTTTFPALDITQTWNAAQTFTLIKGNVTSTSSNGSSLLIDLGTGGGSYTSQFSVDKSGNTIANGYIQTNSSSLGILVNSGPRVTGSGVQIPSNQYLGFTNASGDSNATRDTFIYRGGAAATVQFGADVNGAAVAQTLQAANGITGTDKTGANFDIGSGKGTGAATESAVTVSTPTATTSGTTAQTRTTRLTINSSGIKATGYLSSDGTAGVTAGPFTTITSITVKNGLVTALTGA